MGWPGIYSFPYSPNDYNLVPQLRFLFLPFLTWIYTLSPQVLCPLHSPLWRNGFATCERLFSYEWPKTQCKGPVESVPDPLGPVCHCPQLLHMQRAWGQPLAWTSEEGQKPSPLAQIRTLWGVICAPELPFRISLRLALCWKHTLVSPFPVLLPTFP